MQPLGNSVPKGDHVHLFPVCIKRVAFTILCLERTNMYVQVLYKEKDLSRSLWFIIVPKIEFSSMDHSIKTILCVCEFVVYNVFVVNSQACGR